MKRDPYTEEQQEQESKRLLTMIAHCDCLETLIDAYSDWLSTQGYCSRVRYAMENDFEEAIGIWSYTYAVLILRARIGTS